MFPTKALLVHVDCPDHLEGRCQRPSCPFGHVSRPRALPDEDDEQTPEEVVGGGSSKKPGSSKQGISASSSASSASASAQSSFLNAIYGAKTGGQAANQPRNAYAAKLAAERSRQPAAQPAGSRPSSTASNPPSPSLSPSPSSQSTTHPRRVESATATSNGILTPPTIPRSSHPLQSPTDLASRQKTVSSLFTAFSSLYAGLIPQAPSVSAASTASSSSSADVERLIYEAMKKVMHRYASDNALEAEKKVFRAAGVNRLTYRNSAVTTMVGINKRKTAEANKKGAKDEEESIRELGKRACLAAIGDQDSMESCIRAVFDASTLIGTGDEVEAKVKAKEKRAQGKLTRQRLVEAGFLAPIDLLRKQGYPIPPRKDDQSDIEHDIEEAWGRGGVEPDGSGMRTACDRCQALFEVRSLSEDDLPDIVEEGIRQKLRESKRACIYHWGKKRFVKESMRGPRVPRWTCCNALDAATTNQSPRLSDVAQSAGLLPTTSSGDIGGGGEGGEVGCSRGPHVFKEERVEDLHRREAFHAAKIPSSSRPTGRHDILALDCELVYTTAGMSLARATILDEAGKVLLDLYVLPSTPVLDYNTRFSGIKESDLASNKAVSLSQAREQLAGLMHKDTVLVGHGLENDLAALRLVHGNVVDSVFLFRHQKGLPFRMGLRDLTEKKLGKLIQRGNAEQGHDAAEDANAALELVRWKLLNEPTDIPILRPPKEEAAPNADANVSGSPPSGGSESLASDNNNKAGKAPVATTGPSAKATASLFMPKASSTIIRRN